MAAEQAGRAGNEPRKTVSCRSCGTDIAANALICFRCGTATAEARIPAPAASAGYTRRMAVRLVILAGLAAVLVRVVACGSLL